MYAVCFGMFKGASAHICLKVQSAHVCLEVQSQWSSFLFTEEESLYPELAASSVSQESPTSASWDDPCNSLCGYSGSELIFTLARQAHDSQDHLPNHRKKNIFVKHPGLSSNGACCQAWQDLSSIP